MLTEGKFYWVLLLTVFWTVVNVLFHVGFGVLLAVALNGPIRGKTIYRILLIIPWAVPAYITALTWRSMFDAEYGAVNLLASHAHIYSILGIEPINWLGDATAMFAALYYRQCLAGLPVYDGHRPGRPAGDPQRIVRSRPNRSGVAVATVRAPSRSPLLKPVLAPAVTLGAIWTFNNLNVVWLVSNGGEPADQTHILVSYVYKAVFNKYQYGYGAALSMVIFFLLLACSLFFLQRTRATENVYG